MSFHNLLTILILCQGIQKVSRFEGLKEYAPRGLIEGLPVQIAGQVNGHTDRQTDRRTDRQTDRVVGCATSLRRRQSTSSKSASHPRALGHAACPHFLRKTLALQFEVLRFFLFF